MSEDNILVSTTSCAAEASGYDAARRGAAFFDRADRGFLAVSGKDRASYLHGLLTNDIAALKAGEGCYAAYLTPQGRMIADLWVYELGDVILLVMSRDVKDTVLTKPDQFIFTRGCPDRRRRSTFACVAIVGPGAAKVTTQVLTVSRSKRLTRLASTAMFAPEIRVGRQSRARHRSGEPGYDLFVEAAQVNP